MLLPPEGGVSGFGRPGATDMDSHRLMAKLWKSLIALVMAFFVINVALMVAAVATSSVARRWLGTWLPEGYTLGWYLAAWKEFQLGSVLWVTVEVVAAVVFLSILIGGTINGIRKRPISSRLPGKLRRASA